MGNISSYSTRLCVDLEACMKFGNLIAAKMRCSNKWCNAKILHYKPKSERLSASILEQYPCNDVDINQYQKKRAIYVSYEGFSDNWNEWIFDPTSEDIKADLISSKPERSNMSKLSILQELFKACQRSNIQNASNPKIANVLNGK